MKTLTMQELHSEYARSCTKHGTWQGYTLAEAIEAVESEIKELQCAIAQNHLRGKHSVEVESLQVANVCLKLYEKLKGA